MTSKRDEMSRMRRICLERREETKRTVCAKVWRQERLWQFEGTVVLSRTPLLRHWKFYAAKGLGKKEPWLTYRN